MTNFQKYLIISLACFLPIVFLFALYVGPVEVKFSAIWRIFLNNFNSISSDKDSIDTQALILGTIRLPRVLLSIVIGSILAITGAAIQGLFRNPLADPSVIGVSGGAALFAAIYIILSDKIFSIPQSLSEHSFLMMLFTFTGAFCTTLLIFSLSRTVSKMNVSLILLAGIGVNALSGALVGLLIYIADDVQLRSFTFWTLGSLAGANWSALAWATAALVVVSIFFLPLYKPLNLLSLGEEQAQYLGVRIERLQIKLIFISAIGIGISVALCGFIGFVGLIVPHIFRLLAGSDHRFLMPASALGGAILLMMADTFSRIVAAPAEVPIGIITSLLGAPVFLFALFKEKKYT